MGQGLDPTADGKIEAVARMRAPRRCAERAQRVALKQNGRQPRRLTPASIRKNDSEDIAPSADQGPSSKGRASLSRVKSEAAASRRCRAGFGRARRADAAPLEGDSESPSGHQKVLAPWLRARAGFASIERRRSGKEHQFPSWETTVTFRAMTAVNAVRDAPMSARAPFATMAPRPGSP